MSRLTLLTSALAVLALGAGAIGYAATGNAAGEGEAFQSPILAQLPARRALPQPDRTIGVDPQRGLAAALLASGVGGLDAALAGETAGDVGGRADLWLGASVGPHARGLERLAIRTKPGQTILIERHGDGFLRRDVIEPVDMTPVRIRLDGGAGLAAGLVEAGLPRETRDDVLDELRGARAEAIDLIVAHEGSPSVQQYGAPLYLGAYLASGEVRRWIGEGGRLRPLGREEAAAAAGLLRPLPGPVTSNPGLRFHPILRFLRWHNGTDFASPPGTPVQAAAEGRVIDAGWQGGYGRAVRLLHNDGSTTLYAHLSAMDVSPGERISRGAVIGRVGATGLATGPHLHFEWRRGGETLRPQFAASTPSAGSAITPEQQARLRTLLSAPFRLPPDRRS